LPPAGSKENEHKSGSNSVYGQQTEAEKRKKEISMVKGKKIKKEFTASRDVRRASMVWS
jgi:hypothetical protein